MANNPMTDIAIQYTDGIYATRFELRKFLGTSLIDYQWGKIQSYREDHRLRLSLKTLANHSFYLTKTPSIDAKIDKLSALLDAFVEKTEASFEDENDKYRLLKTLLLPALKAAASYEEKSISELSIKAMLNGMYREDNPDHVALLGYKKAIKDLEENPPYDADEDFLARMYGLLSGKEELTSFYRSSDHGSRYSTMTVARVYQECPASQIEAMMGNLFSFLRYEAVSPLLKAIIALFAIRYLKPFEAHNDLMAILLAKGILLSAGYHKEIAYLPLESLLLESDKLKDVLTEAQSSDDLTYFLLYAVKFLETSIEENLDYLAKFKADALKEEMIRLSPKEMEEVPLTPVEVEPKQDLTPLEMEPSPIPVVISMEESNLEAVEEPDEPKKPMMEQTISPVIEETPVLKPIVTRVSSLPSGPAAIRAPKSTLSDKEAKEVARYILETNPNIRKAQAIFYATHCNIGSYYSIQDYKKSAKCVYETARTSMDNLAREGFYQKLQIKNKFVYTPVKQGDNQ